MHILVIPSWYPVDAHDTGGVFFREQALAMAQSGNQLGVLVPRIAPIYAKSDVDRRSDVAWSQEGHLLVGRLDITQYVPKARVFTVAASRARIDEAFNEYVKRAGRPDILHAHSLYPGGFIAAQLSKHHGIPWILTEHRSLNHMKLATPLGRKAEVDVVKTASARLGVSRDHAAHVGHRIGRRGGDWDFTPDMLPAQFEDVVIGVRDRNAPFVIGHLSVLDPVKRVDLIIDAFEELAQRYPNIRLKIGGPIDTALGAPVKARVESSAVHERIDLTGTISREKIQEFYRDIDLFVLPSVTETFGVVLIEALAMGVPLVTTDTWGARTVIDDDSDGTIVPVNDYAALVSAIDSYARAQQDVQQRDESRTKRRQRCIERFGKKTFVDSYNDLYNRVAADGATRR